MKIINNIDSQLKTLLVVTFLGLAYQEISWCPGWIIPYLSSTTIKSF